MVGANGMEHRDDDARASSQAQQENIDRIAARLEALVEQRDPGVKAAMSDQADGASGEYRAKEQRWNAAADEVRGIIRLMHQALDENDAPAKRSLNEAKPTADDIG